MDRKDIDWNEKLLKNWIETCQKKHTEIVYRGAYREWFEFTNGKSVKEMINQAQEDLKKDTQDRTFVAKNSILKFYDYLKAQGKADSTAHTMVGAIRSLYAYYDIPIMLKGRQRLPRVRIKNKRMQLSVLDVKALVDQARNPRDRAMILAMFQGGMDVSTLCEMKYGDIADGLAKNELPLKVDLIRGKTETEYYTFLGKDAVSALKAYLNDAKARGIQVSAKTPLFVQEIKGKNGDPLALRPAIVEKVMREVAHHSALVDETNNGQDTNPANPHALRESFSSIMVNNGVPSDLVDFWLGHEIGSMGDAYKAARLNEARAMYADKEKLVSIGMNGSQALENMRTTVSMQGEEIAKLKRAIFWLLDEVRDLGGEDWDEDDWEKIEKEYGFKRADFKA